jgi:peptidoglycan-associated lipoprotein
MIAKRLFVFLVALGLAAFMVGCGGKAAVEEVPAEVEPPPVVEPEIEEPAPEPEEPTEVPKPKLNDVFFAFDKYNLTAESKSILEDNARELKRASDFNIVIEGHCDERGTKSYNMALGEKRANAAKDYLVALGIRSSRIATISYGKERPFDLGHNEAAWAKNRRAHMVLKQ